LFIGALRELEDFSSWVFGRSRPSTRAWFTAILKQFCGVISHRMFYVLPNQMKKKIPFLSVQVKRAKGLGRFKWLFLLFNRICQVYIISFHLKPREKKQGQLSEAKDRKEELNPLAIALNSKQHFAAD
jgi:hypothetical protein